VIGESKEDLNVTAKLWHLLQLLVGKKLKKPIQDREIVNSTPSPPPTVFNHPIFVPWQIRTVVFLSQTLV